MTPGTSTLARKAANAIIADLDDRRGLKSEWRQIDKPIQNEIRDVWTDIIAKAIEAARSVSAAEPETREE